VKKLVFGLVGTVLLVSTVWFGLNSE